jgi:diguanylate cyclase (GGDEF)-like protein
VSERGSRQRPGPRLSADGPAGAPLRALPDLVGMASTAVKGRLDDDDHVVALLARVIQRISAAVLLLKAAPGAPPALDELDSALDDIGATLLSLPARAPLQPDPQPAPNDDDVPVALIRFQLHAGATGTNRAWTALTGLERDASLGAGWLAAIAPGRRMEAAVLVNRVLFGGGAATVEWQLSTGDRARWAAASMSSSRLSHCSVALVDLTAHKLHEADLSRRANHDPLTGVANRGLLLDRATQALERLAQGPGGCAVLFIDLDQLKNINDRFGHRDGDVMLVELAWQLNSVLRPADTLARVGGDEFVVLCEELATVEDAMSIARRVNAAIRQPVRLRGGLEAITASIGIAFANSPDADVEDLLHRADRAMYEAKRRGGNGYEIDGSPTVSSAPSVGPIDGLHTAIGHLRAAAGALGELTAGNLASQEGGMAETATEAGDSIDRALRVLQGAAHLPD